jgi:hypothetical protein
VKVVFLDIDGVLNSHDWFNVTDTRRDSPEYPESHFDPKPVSLLNEITDRTGAVIVVSSTWRLGRSVSELRELLKSVGVTGYVTDKTPHLGGPRGHDIYTWLQRPTGHVEAYVILDDDSDMDPLARRHVKTTFDHGLTREHAERAVAMLGESKAA